MEKPELMRELRKIGIRPFRIKTTVHYMRRFDFDVDYVIDVGVWTGTPYLYRAFEDTKFVLIDPLQESRDAIEAAEFPKDYDFHVVALGSETGEAPLRVTTTEPGEGGNLSSFHDRVDGVKDRIQGIEVRMVPVVPLDRIAKDYPGPLGLKIDAEGHELDVLEGATETLERCEFVILELSLAQRFADTPPPSTLIALLAKAGLEFRDIFDSSSYEFDMPRHVDMLFTRWSAPLAQDAA